MIVPANSPSTLYTAYDGEKRQREVTDAVIVRLDSMTTLHEWQEHKLSQTLGRSRGVVGDRDPVLEVVEYNLGKVLSLSSFL